MAPYVPKMYVPKWFTVYLSMLCAKNVRPQMAPKWFTSPNGSKWFFVPKWFSNGFPSPNRFRRKLNSQKTQANGFLFRMPVLCLSYNNIYQFAGDCYYLYNLFSQNQFGYGIGLHNRFFRAFPIKPCRHHHFFSDFAV